MGGAVSAGADNDELVDNLLEADYIRSATVERVFRAVDRGHYFTVEYKERAYRDIAWKSGNLHISAPCIYSKVMENLKLAPGLSFLNLGSGTGYLSTMAGLILGPYGINHGIEIHEDVLNYATKKLGEFILSANAVDEYEFCEPKFVNGNCLHLGSSVQQYDRVYCSAACPENHESYMKNLIKVGGILVIPVNDQLLQICRTSDTNWESKSVLPVSFATLISGKSPDLSDPLKMPDIGPLPLQDICRFKVRSILKRNIDIEHPELKKISRAPKKREKKKTKQFVMPIYRGSSDDGGEDFVDFQTTRRLVNLSQSLRPTSPRSTVFRRCGETPENYQSSVNQPDQGNAMEEDANFNVETDNILDEMSDSDFEDLENMLTMSETSGSDSESGKQKLPSEVKGKARRQKNRSKQEKVDSGIVEDFENDEEIASDSDGGTDEENKSSVDDFSFLRITSFRSQSRRLSLYSDLRKKEKMAQSDSNPPAGSPDSASTSSLFNFPSGSEEPPPDVVTYTTCMKEKIKLLPLPITLKYFINFYREL